MKQIPLFLTGVGFQELIIVLVFTVLMFFAFRALLLWYWKINLIVENQQKQITVLQDLLVAMKRIADKKDSADSFVK